MRACRHFVAIPQQQRPVYLPSIKSFRLAFRLFLFIFLFFYYLISYTGKGSQAWRKPLAIDRYSCPHAQTPWADRWRGYTRETGRESVDGVECSDVSSIMFGWAYRLGSQLQTDCPYVVKRSGLYRTSSRPSVYFFFIVARSAIASMCCKYQMFFWIAQKGVPANGWRRKPLVGFRRIPQGDRRERSESHRGRMPRSLRCLRHGPFRSCLHQRVLKSHPGQSSAPSLIHFFFVY